MHCARTAIIAIATLAVIQVSGCGGGDASKPTKSAETLPATTTPVATTPAVSDTTVPIPVMTVAVPNTTAVSVVPVSALTAQLQAAVDEAVRAAPSIPGLAVHVEVPARHLAVSVAAGLADRATATPLTSDAGFRIASNTKTFTAAAILRLVEQGRLSLDTPIAGLDAPETVDALRADGYRVDSITVRHLLQHTSGIYNYGRDPAYETAVAAEPAKRWTRLEQVRFAVDHGDPLGEPGTVYAYSDTGYALLGEILERVTGTTLDDAYRTLLGFERLHLDATYVETLEPAPPGVAPRAHQYFGELDGFDTDPSFDGYGPAGLVSTVDDLSTFYRALLSGDVFDRPETLATMLEIPATNAEAHAGMGIFGTEVAGSPCWQHSGFWGTFVLTCPQIGVTLAASWNQALYPDFDSENVLRGVLELATAP